MVETTDANCVAQPKKKKKFVSSYGLWFALTHGQTELSTTPSNRIYEGCNVHFRVRVEKDKFMGKLLSEPWDYALNPRTEYVVNVR